MDCPRCQQPLRDVRSVLVCLRCGGAFLATAARDTIARVLDPMAQQTAALVGLKATADVDEAVVARCPMCRGPMQRFRVGAVDVDTCLIHGSWYDRGELEDVRDALLAGVHGVPSPDLPTVPATTTKPTTAPKPTTQAPLELARTPKRRPPAPRRADDGGTMAPVPIDAGAQKAIANLIKSEHREARRHDRQHRRGKTSAAHDVADFLNDLVD